MTSCGESIPVLTIKTPYKVKEHGVFLVLSKRRVPVDVFDPKEANSEEEANNDN